MNFDEAIKCHTAWKSKLATYIHKPDGSLASTTVGDERRCELGKWINSEGSAHSQVPEFSRLRDAHSNFHAAAAEVIKRADSGQRVADDIVLGGNSAYSVASTAVVSALMAMKSKVRS